MSSHSAEARIRVYQEVEKKLMLSSNCCVYFYEGPRPRYTAFEKKKFYFFFSAYVSVYNSIFLNLHPFLSLKAYLAMAALSLCTKMSPKP